MIGAVYDCVVFLQAAASPRGVAAACLGLVNEGHVRLYLSDPVLHEVQDVLGRPAVRKRFPQLTDEKVARFLQKLTASAEWLDDVPAVAEVPRDPKDEPYLDLAVAAKVPFLVTRDHDLLSLNDDAEFRRQFPSLSIVDPKWFLSHVRAVLAKELGYE